MTTKSRRCIALLMVGAGMALGGCAETWDEVASTLGLDPQPPASSQPAEVNSGEPQELTAAELQELADLAPAAGPSADQHRATQAMDQLGQEVVAVLRDRSLDRQQRIAYFRQILARDLEIASLARFMLGRYWNKTSPAQQQAFQAVFQDFLVQTYSRRLGGAAVVSFEITDTKAIGSRKEFLVYTLVSRDQGKPVRAIWRVRAKEDRVRIVDLMVEGISLALTLRQEFSSILRSAGGVDELIAKLRERTA